MLLAPHSTNWGTHISYRFDALTHYLSPWIINRSLAVRFEKQWNSLWQQAALIVAVLLFCKHHKRLQHFSQFLSNPTSNRGTSVSVARQHCSDRPLPAMRWQAVGTPHSTCVMCHCAASSVADYLVTNPEKKYSTSCRKCQEPPETRYEVIHMDKLVMMSTYPQIIFSETTRLQNYSRIMNKYIKNHPTQKERNYTVFQ